MFKFLVKVIRPVVVRWPGLAGTYRSWRARRWRGRAPTATPFGFAMNGHAGMMSGQFEPVETEIICSILDQTDLFLNVGANVGYYVCHALQKNCDVVAVEPLADNIHYLLGNIRANQGSERAEVFPVAVSDEVGVVDLYGHETGASLVPGWAGASADNGQLTPVTTIDRLIGLRIAKTELGAKRCFVLMDVEGMEDRAIAGAQVLLSLNPAPIWMLEIAFDQHLGGQVNPTFLSTFRRFFDEGYRAWTATLPMNEVGEEEIDRMMKQGRNHLDTHNFIFAKDEGRLPLHLKR